MYSYTSEDFSFFFKDSENRDFIKKDKCDELDYRIAISCGLIGGIVDLVFVGDPENSILKKHTDKQVDKFVIRVASLSGWKPKGEATVQSAIGYLERISNVNYDQRSSIDVGGVVKNLNAKNHHYKSLSHASSIIGLIFSVIDQLRGTSTFISGGKLHVIPSKSKLNPNDNLALNIFKAITNWFIHLASDMAGSSGARGNGARGMGITMPFYQLFGLFNNKKFKVGDARQELSIIAERAFKDGYDFRFGLTASIPVVITGALIRFFTMIRKRYEYGMELYSCIPNKSNADLRVMLIFGYAGLCLLDGIDALVRSGGKNALTFFKRINLVAWPILFSLVAKEVFIRANIAADNLINSYKVANEYLSKYLNELKALDIQKYKEETETYNIISNRLDGVTSPEELNEVLVKIYDDFEMYKPWEGDFDEFMSDKNNTMHFR